MAKQTFYVYKECHSKKKAKNGMVCKVNVSEIPCAIPPTAKGIKTIKAKSAKDAKNRYLGG